jgi:alpha-galactosidase
VEIECNGNKITVDSSVCSPIPGGYLVSSSRLTMRLPSAPARYLYSGWQSWSLTAWVDTSLSLGQMRPRLLHPMQTDPLYAREKRPNGSWYGAVELEDGTNIFLGALGTDSHVLLDGQSLSGWYEAGTGEWFISWGNEDDFYSHYARLLGTRFGTGRVKDPFRVWCSWYSLYTEISEQKLLKILADLGELPFDVFQIDDGWQLNIGDWEPNEKFPSGMASFASHIKDTGRKAGLWLAPLLVTPSAGLFHEHPEWLLHNEKGNLVSAGFNWGSQLYALDTTHPGALKWLQILMRKIRQWGYDYFKLDFLSAGALPGKHHTDMPREAAYRQGLEVIRQSLGDAYFLACGAPILPSLGLCDAIRIGPDVAEIGFSDFRDNALRNFTTPGLRNALRTSLHRLWLSPLVHVDPDVVYFRSSQNNLTRDEMKFQQAMGEICRFKACSDVPSWMTSAEMDELRSFLDKQPEVRKTGMGSFTIDGLPVEFLPYGDLPPSPGFLQNAEGVFLDNDPQLVSHDIRKGL